MDLSIHDLKEIRVYPVKCFPKCERTKRFYTQKIVIESKGNEPLYITTYSNKKSQQLIGFVKKQSDLKK
jgi:hypothetical protein